MGFKAVKLHVVHDLFLSIAQHGDQPGDAHVMLELFNETRTESVLLKDPCRELERPDLVLWFGEYDHGSARMSASDLKCLIEFLQGQETDHWQPTLKTTRSVSVKPKEVTS